MLVYVADLFLDYLVRGPWRDPNGFNFPTTAEFDPVATVPLLIEGGRLHLGAIIALLVVAAAAVLLGRTIKGFEIRVVGAAPRAARFGGFNSNQLILLTFAISGALAGLAGIIEVAGPVGHLQPGISPGYGFTAIIVAFLGRLNPIGILIAGLFLALTFIGGEQAQIAMKIPLDVTKVFQGILLFYVLACDSLILYRFRLIFAVTDRWPVELVEAIILSVLAASTPLLIAATGELVTERAGVLNLGVEGMMIVGAACGFGGAWLTGSIVIGALCGIVAGTLLSLVFAADDAGPRGQPGRDRSRADHPRRRPVRPDRRRLRRRAHHAGAASPHSRPDRYSAGRPHPVRRGRLRLSLAGAGHRRLAGSCTARAPGLILRASATITSRRMRSAIPCCGSGCFAVMFGGACAGLAGAYLPLAYTPFFIPGMTAGRGWIALALVVFASWRPGAAGDRRLSVRRGDHPATARAGLGRRHSLAIHVGAALSRDRHRAGPDFARAHRRLDRAGRAREPCSCPTAEIHFRSVRDGARRIGTIVHP